MSIFYPMKILHLFYCYAFIFAFLFQVDSQLAFAQRITSSVPASQVPNAYLRSTVPRRLPNITHLRQPKKTPYILDAGDTLSVFIDGVLGPVDSIPPVQFPQAGSDLPPSLGYPVVVRENGKIDLPYIQPLDVRGLTIKQTTQLIEDAYEGGDKAILKPGSNRILVSLMRKRTYRVTVIRPNQTRSNNSRNRNSATQRSDRSATSGTFNLPAGQNDMMHALIRTGGLPGINEESNIRLQRGDRTITVPSHLDLSYGNSEFPRSNSGRNSVYRPAYNSTNRVPTRIAPGQSFDRRDAELRDGDIVSIDSRRAAVYYTSGLLNGGQHLLPRDTDLDVLQAVAIAGRIPSANRSAAQPSELLVLRRLPDNRQVSIRVDLNRALTNPSERILVAPGDTLILRQRPIERAANIGNAALNTFGFRRFGR